jgi:outer membrane protein
MMTRLLLFLALLPALSLPAAAQMKIGYISSETIMQTLPEAIDAQKSLDALVAQWEGELQKMQAEWKRKFDDYEKKRLIMTEQVRGETEKQLRDLDASIADFRNKKFGQNGEMFQKQNEVMKPVQNKLFQILETLAKDDGYDYIFDKSGEILLLYANEKHDLTQKVLQRMQTFGK